MKQMKANTVKTADAAVLRAAVVDFDRHLELL